jgi:hypothetical protein
MQWKIYAVLIFGFGVLVRSQRAGFPVIGRLNTGFLGFRLFESGN